MKKVLFILKERHYSQAKTSYGLINSASLVADYLSKHGYECEVVSVIDANFIDKEIHLFKPDMVIIEALWVPTYKLEELISIKRNKNIKWVVRVHSDIGFLSAETQGIRFLNEYADLHKKNLIIAANSEKFVEVISRTLGHKFYYLPNLVALLRHHHDHNDILEEHDHINIGCFGAMRLLKNQCFQALCSIEAANYLGKKLYFHITPNLGIENDPVLANLIEIFKNSIHDLVIHDWLPNDEFQHLVRRMDIGIQLSFTESFNIVSADFINNNRLVAVSDAIDWLPAIVRASTTDYDDAIRKIIYAYRHRNSEIIKEKEKDSLNKYNEDSKKHWADFLQMYPHKH